MTEAYEYDYGTAHLCDEHYIYGEAPLNLNQISKLVADCYECHITYKEDN